MTNVVAKPDSITLMTGYQSKPLLSWWRYGQGIVATWHAQLDGGNQEWQQWQASDEFMTQVANLVRRRSVRTQYWYLERTLDGELEFVGNRVTQSGRWDSTVPVLTTESAGRVPVKFRAPGRVSVAATNEQLFQSDWGDSSETLQVVQDLADPELVARLSDRRRLEQISAATGGVFEPTNEQLVRVGEAVESRLALWRPLAMFVLLLLVVDAGWRRWTESWKWRRPRD